MLARYDLIFTYNKYIMIQLYDINRSIEVVESSSNMIVSIANNISHPWEIIIIAFFDDFEIFDLNSTDCILRHFELQSARNTFEFLSGFRNNTRHTETGHHLDRFLAWE